MAPMRSELLHKQIVEELFEDVAIKNGILDMLFVLNVYEDALSGEVNGVKIRDAIVTAYTTAMNNTFMASFGQAIRPILLRLLRDEREQLAKKFLIEIAPVVKTALNGNTSRDYFATVKFIEEKLK